MNRMFALFDLWGPVWNNLSLQIIVISPAKVQCKTLKYIDYLNQPPKYLQIILSFLIDSIFVLWNLFQLWWRQLLFVKEDQRSRSLSWLKYTQVRYWELESFQKKIICTISSITKYHQNKIQWPVTMVSIIQNKCIVNV